MFLYLVLREVMSEKEHKFVNSRDLLSFKSWGVIEEGRIYGGGDQGCYFRPHSVLDIQHRATQAIVQHTFKQRYVHIVLFGQQVNRWVRL